MKKIGIVLVAMSLSFCGFAQKKIADFEGMDQVKSVVVNQKMFELMAKVKMDDSDKEAARYLAMIKQLSQLTFYSTADKQTASEMKSVVNQHVVAEKMTEMCRFTENGKLIVFYTKSAQDGQHYTEILLFVDSSTAEDSILFSLRGTIDVNEIAFLSERLKLNGKESIQKAIKGLKK